MFFFTFVFLVNEILCAAAKERSAESPSSTEDGKNSKGGWATAETKAQLTLPRLRSSQALCWHRHTFHCRRFAELRNLFVAFPTLL